MILLSSPDYEGKVVYEFSGNRLASPENISADGSTIYFGKVLNATSYLIKIDGVDYAEVVNTGTGKNTWLFNEVVDTSSAESPEAYNFEYKSNGQSYSKMNIAENIIGYDDSEVYHTSLSGDSGWSLQAYRTISCSASIPSAIYNLLIANAVYQPERLSCDLSTLYNWGNITNGSHSVQIIAKASGYRDSVPSQSIYFGKNVSFVKGQIYGPYTVSRVVDGDTVVAIIDGVETKIRMIGVNTPESVAKSSYRTENCQEGIDASNYTKAQLTGQQIYIEFDTDQYDRYNRFLCYIYRDAEGTQMYNNELIELGYGEAAYYSPNGEHRTFLETTQATARTNGVRNWGTHFFPTKLEPASVILTGSTISWDHLANNYIESYDIKVDGTITGNVIQPAGTTHVEYDLTNLGLSSGTYRINVVAIPTNSTHEKSNNSNNINYIVS